MASIDQAEDAKAIWDMDRRHFIHPYTDFATFKQEGSHVISKAKGVFVMDSDGNRFLDGIAGLWCVNIGHGREEMADAMRDQVLAMQYFNPFGHSTNEPASILAQKLAQLAPGNLNHVFYTCGGSTANDSAMRVIHYYNNLRGKPNKKKVISRNNGYHGSTYIAAHLTGIHATKNSFDRAAESWISHVSSADMYRRPAGAEDLPEKAYAQFLVDELENHILQLGADNVAAFIAEPVMGAGGVLVAPEGYHRGAWEVCQKHDVLFVADEVVTGFGRLGEWMASEALFGFVPDVMILAKGINSGYVPLGAALFSEEIYKVISEPQCEDGVFSMGFTYSGHAVACAAALKNIEIIERENLLSHVRNLGPYLQSQAKELLDISVVGDVRGQGFMLGIDLVSDQTTKEPLMMAAEVYQKCLSKGLIVRPIGNILVLSPPLTFTRENIDQLLSILRASLEELAREM